MPANEISAAMPDRLPREIGEDNVRKYFLLKDEDLQEVRRCRGTSNKLGFGDSFADQMAQGRAGIWVAKSGGTRRLKEVLDLVLKILNCASFAKNPVAID